MPPRTVAWAVVKNKGLQLLCPWDELGKVAHRQNTCFEIISDKNNLSRGSEIYPCVMGCAPRSESEVNGS